MSVKNFAEMNAEQRFAYKAGYRAALRELQKRCCSVCNGAGAIPGFWLGTVKTCPACHGTGYRASPS